MRNKYRISQIYLVNARQNFRWRAPLGWVLWLVFSISLLGCQSQDQVEVSVPTLPIPTNTVTPTRTHTPTFVPTDTASHTSTSPPTTAVPPTPTLTPTVVTSNMILEPAIPAADCLATNLPETACTGVSANEDWTPVIREFAGVEMVLVPAGCFMMGTETGLPDEQPVHEVCIDKPYWIDLTETTVAQFASFLNGQGDTFDEYKHWVNPTAFNIKFLVPVSQENGQWQAHAKYQNNPIEGATWFGSNDYCAWRGARLPTEAEWEYAARGPDNWLYPWGNEYIRENVVRIRGKTPAVGSKPQAASWVGALDMCSSLFEWTSSLYRPYPYDAEDGREIGPEQDSTSDRAYRGSPWYHAVGMYDNVSATARFNVPPDFSPWYYGIRCARSFDPQE